MDNCFRSNFHEKHKLNGEPIPNGPNSGGNRVIALFLKGTHL